MNLIQSTLQRSYWWQEALVEAVKTLDAFIVESRSMNPHPMLSERYY